MPFRDFIASRSAQDLTQSQARLAKEVLAEIPDQFISYMKANHIQPKPPIRQPTLPHGAPRPQMGATAPEFNHATPPPPYQPMAWLPVGATDEGGKPPWTVVISHTAMCIPLWVCQDWADLVLLQSRGSELVKPRKVHCFFCVSAQILKKIVVLGPCFFNFYQKTLKCYQYPYPWQKLPTSWHLFSHTLTTTVPTSVTPELRSDLVCSLECRNWWQKSWYAQGIWKKDQKEKALSSYHHSTTLRICTCNWGINFSWPYSDCIVQLEHIWSPKYCILSRLCWPRYYDTKKVECWMHLITQELYIS